MHGGNCKVGFAHLFRQPVDLALSVAEDDSLRDGQRIVQIAQCVKFPFFTFNGNEKLFDAFQSQFITEKNQPT